MIDWQSSWGFAGTGMLRPVWVRLLVIPADGAAVVATEMFPTEASLDGVEGDAWWLLVAPYRAESFRATPFEAASFGTASVDSDRARSCSLLGEMACDVLGSWILSSWSSFERRPGPFRSAFTSSLQIFAASMKYSRTLDESARDLFSTSSSRYSQNFWKSLMSPPTVLY